ncbi:MAG: GC-type dockerin domain-anchored protein [Phycisphaerales bacterium]|nr:GC-type dockerin domain-anchored protein [Phycisphaerales bacterium]
MNLPALNQRLSHVLRAPAVIAAAAIGSLAAIGSTASAQLSGLTFQYQSTYLQTSTSPPTTSTAHDFTAAVSFPNSQPPSGVEEAWVEKPSGTMVNLDTTSSFYYTPNEVYPTREALMAAWPTGLYQFTIAGIDEDDNEFANVYTKQQPYAAGVWPSQVPAFTPASYTGLLGMNPAQPRAVVVNMFTVTPPGNGQLSGLSVNLRFGTLLGPTAWSSLTTIGAPTPTRTIPAGALQPNTDYYATWYFAQRVVSPPSAEVEYSHLSFGNLTRVAFRTGNAVACPPDIGVQGGAPGADAQLDNNDFIVFIDYFFTQNPLADRGAQGGVPGTDGVFDNNDFIVFIDQFFAGC